MELIGRVNEEGKFIGRKIELIKFAGKNIKIRIDVIRDKRTDQQNRYLHAILGKLSNQMGIEFEDLKSYFKYSCLFAELVKSINPNQEFYNYDISSYLILKNEKLNQGLIMAESMISTSDLDVYSFTKLIDYIRDYSSKNKIMYIPTPQEYYEHYKNTNSENNRRNN